jgi:hypothetical protein
MSEPDIAGMVARENLHQQLTVREQVLDVLLEKIAQDRYPSTQMLDDVEQLLTPWRISDYAEVLMEKVRRDRFPSRAMVQRLVRLSG